MTPHPDSRLDRLSELKVLRLGDGGNPDNNPDKVSGFR